MKMFMWNFLLYLKVGSLIIFQLGKDFKSIGLHKSYGYGETGWQNQQ